MTLTSYSNGQTIDAAVVNQYYSVLTGQWVEFCHDVDYTGASDSSTAIQNKLNGGGDVVLGPGTVRIDQILQMPSNTRLRGAGMGLTTIQAKSAYAPTPTGLNGYNMVVAASGATTNIEIRDLTFDGNAPNVSTITAPATEANSHLIDIRSITKVRVINVEVINAIRWSIHCLRCTNVRVEGCRVLSGQTTGARTQQDCIHLTECTQFRILNNDCDSGTSGDGDDCIAIRSATSGFPITDGLIQGNVLASGQRAIALVSAGDNVKDITIGVNEIRRTRADGIIFNSVSGSGIFQNISIKGVVMHDISSSSGHGIHLQNQAVSGDNYNNVSIEGVVIRSFLNTGGILIYAGQGQRLNIANVVATDVRGTRGIEVGDSGHPVLYFNVTGCNVDMTASGAASPCIQISRASHGAVVGNTGLGVTGGGSIGVQLVADGTNGCTDVQVAGNRLRNFATGVLETNSGANPDRNVIMGNGLAGCTTAVTAVGASTLSSGTTWNRT